MNNFYRLIFIITFFILGCNSNVIEEKKATKEINSLNLNIFTKNGNKKYSIKSPYSTYNNAIDKFEFQKATINIFQKGKLKYSISSDDATLSNNNKILKLNGNVKLKTNNQEEDYLYADSFIWNIDETNYLLTGNIRFENNNVILTSGQAKMGSDNIIEFFNPVKYIIKNENNENKYEINSENDYYNLNTES